jgi:hypothetical protein
MGYGGTIVLLVEFSYVVPWQLFSSPYTMTSTTPETAMNTTTRGICFAGYILSVSIYIRLLGDKASFIFFFS